RNVGDAQGARGVGASRRHDRQHQETHDERERDEQQRFVESARQSPCQSRDRRDDHRGGTLAGAGPCCICGGGGIGGGGGFTRPIGRLLPGFAASSRFFSGGRLWYSCHFCRTSSFLSGGRAFIVLNCSRATRR